MEKANFLRILLKKWNLKKTQHLKTFRYKKTKSNGYFYKYIFGKQDYGSSFQNFLLTSGLKFNKVELDVNLEKKKTVTALSFQLYVWTKKSTKKLRQK